jgi:hypothetical protein
MMDPAKMTAAPIASASKSPLTKAACAVVAFLSEALLRAVRMAAMPSEPARSREVLSTPEATPAFSTLTVATLVPEVRTLTGQRS